MAGVHMAMWMHLAGLALMAAGVVPQAGETFEVRTGRVTVVCPLTVGGRFEVKTTAVTGQVVVDERSPDVGGVLSVDLRTLDAGIGLRTSHLKETYLEVQRGPGFASATLSHIVLDAPVAALSGRAVGFQAQFTLHGQTRPIAGHVEVARKDGGYEVAVKFPLRIDAFGIARPAYLGVGVTNDIDVTVRASLIRSVPSSG